MLGDAIRDDISFIQRETTVSGEVDLRVLLLREVDTTVVLIAMLMTRGMTFGGF